MPEAGSEESRPRAGDDDESYARARSRALRVLARREITRRDLGVKLRAAGYGSGVATRILDELEAGGLLDDRRFCGLYLRSQARSRPRSWRLLARDASNKGVSAEIVESIRAEMEAETSEQSLAVAAARKKARALREDPGALRRALAGRGFTPSVAEHAIREILGPVAERRDDQGSYDDV